MKPKDSAERAESLCLLLRRYPYWSNGHRLLAEARLEQDDVAHAYAASLCFRQLVATQPAQRAQANLLLGRCYLRRGEWRAALGSLQTALADAPLCHEILEELAAAHILAGNYSEAQIYLEQIREDSRSAQAKAALEFAKSKA